MGKVVFLDLFGDDLNYKLPLSYLATEVTDKMLEYATELENVEPDLSNIIEDGLV